MRTHACTTPEQNTSLKDEPYAYNAFSILNTFLNNHLNIFSLYEEVSQPPPPPNFAITLLVGTCKYLCKATLTRKLPTQSSKILLGVEFAIVSVHVWLMSSKYCVIWGKKQFGGGS
jgi:hypothetical protein